MAKPFEFLEQMGGWVIWLEHYLKLECFQGKVGMFLIAVGEDPLLLRQSQQALPHLCAGCFNLNT